MKLREALRGKLSANERKLLKTAYDIVGAIAILDIQDELKKKEKLIANTLLLTNNNIKTVVKKVGIRGGQLRLQKYEVLAGENTKETVHRESGMNIKLNIEQVYFSVRLATERLRICKQVKQDEHVLIMFSGCAPYCCVLAKNSKAKMVYGIELNKHGHLYGRDNVIQNKLQNVFLMQGDVKKIMPEITKHLIGLKTSMKTKELARVLKEKPSIMELFVSYDECTKQTKKQTKLEKTIQKLIKAGIEPVVHAPWHDGKETTTLTHVHPARLGKNLYMFGKLGKLAKKYNMKVIVHAMHENEHELQKMLTNLPKLKQYMRWFYFENMLRAPFNNISAFKQAIKAGVKNACFDTCHFYEDHPDNNKMLAMIKALHVMPLNMYYHLADSDAKVHALEVGQGGVDFAKLMPYYTTGIAEINCKNYLNPIEMIRSRNKLGSMQKRFDRIAMPLPKDADSFLDLALSTIKKGGTIHLYDFTHEKDMPQASLTKVKKACEKAKKRYQIKGWNACGSYGPGKFRICVDIKILN
jgi:tRNA G37 N-methylase Trm5